MRGVNGFVTLCEDVEKSLISAHSYFELWNKEIPLACLLARRRWRVAETVVGDAGNKKKQAGRESSSVYIECGSRARAPLGSLVL